LLNEVRTYFEQNSD